jgi:hypothetical protein
MLVRFWTVTVTLAVPLTPSEVAVMVAVPVATPVTRPPFVIVATVSFELDQPTVEPESWLLLPSEKVPVACSCCEPLMATVVEAGVMKIELMEGFMKKPVQAAKVRHKRMLVLVVSALRTSTSFD